MAKRFNVAAVCIPEKHYMVNIEGRLEAIKALVDAGNYITMNRARQYGKTTTLMALERYLQEEYYVVSLDFQTFGSAEFRDENTFALSFADSFFEELNRSNEFVGTDKFQKALAAMERSIENSQDTYVLRTLFKELSAVCETSDRKFVLIIDEVDSATNNQIFLDFLAQLRAYYIGRERRATFQSVILAGVYDIKNLKRKLRPEEEHKVNSPWNTREGNEPGGSLLTSGDCPRNQMVVCPFDIAIKFSVDMSFSAEDIAGMLREYEADYHTGMDLGKIAELLYAYTSGYPFLVSRLCQLMDEEISRECGSKEEAWTFDGFMAAEHRLTSEKNTLFESLIGKVLQYPELDKLLQEHIFCGKSVSYVASNPTIDLAAMFGIIQEENGQVVPANKIFDTVLSDYYLSLRELHTDEIYRAALQDKNQFVENGRLNMRLILERFTEHFHDLYGEKNEAFLEEEGRKYFLLYLRPIINGTGSYSMEALTRTLNRTDLMVYYQGEVFVIEMKIWNGIQYHEKGERQLLGYMEDYHQEIGYLLTFCFNKKKEIGVKEVVVEGKTLVEAMV